MSATAVPSGSRPAKRGSLRVYLGAAPGVGKTFAMLNEGWRRKERGADVVVGSVETHGRAHTAEQVRDLEVVPRARLRYRGAGYEEMDIDAVLARRPEVVLVDELAHSNVPGTRNAKRWEDVEELLDAGIHVISTVNIQHLESLNDVVERITGITQRETIPDHIVRGAEQVELVDQTPEALRRRMAHGNIYAAEQVDAALGNYFRAGNLGALRELALLWVAGQVDEALEDYRRRHGIDEPWETRERVIVAITGAPHSEHLIRRAARIAERAHGELLGVHILADSGLSSLPSDLVVAHRHLLEELGGKYREVSGSDVAVALFEFARAENGTQVVLGASRRSRWQELSQGSVINRVIRLSGPIDVHVISAAAGDENEDGRARLPVPGRGLSPLPPRRQVVAWSLTAAGLPLLTVVLANLRNTVGLSSVLLLYLLVAMAVAAVGGVVPAIAASVSGFLLANWYFTPPIYRFSIGDSENLLALVVYLGAAGLVSVMVDRVARSRLDATRSRAEAEALAALAGSRAEEESLPTILARLRDAFGMASASLLHGDSGEWHVEASAGTADFVPPEGADVVKELEDDYVLVLSGRPLAANDYRVLNALAAQLSTAIEAKRLAAEANRARGLSEANDLRAALLQAVSHDLRTPIASIKASISSIRQPDLDWPVDQLEEFHATIEDETDRLDTLVANLLDMSRLQAGALDVQLGPLGLEEVVPAAVAGLGPRGQAVEVDVPETLPLVLADSVLLERALTNVIDNALTASPEGSPVKVEAGAIAGRVDIRVVDQGPGIPMGDRDAVFQPFQRLVDHGTGVGLGLAIARGFIGAMGGELVIEDTPGGGVTMVVSLRTGPT
ncbi:MAG: DUF4118 domain-containing protein [Acidimicrobiia bacterium]